MCSPFLSKLFIPNPTMNKANVLIIDDEPQIRRLLTITLKSNNYTVLEAVDGKEGLVMASMHPPDLILLDLGLPDINGQDVLIKLRQWFSGPVLILSVQKSEAEIVKALDNGANDYLTKPFRTNELLARIRTAIRSATNDQMNTKKAFDGIEIDFSARLVKKNGELVKLTSTEYSLLSLLMRNEDKVLTHQFLLRSIWGPGYINQSQYLRVYIANLRKKIEADPNNPRFIITESGVGYRFWGNISGSGD